MVYYEVVKRLLDIIISVVVLIVGAPLMLVAAIAIKLDSRGPVIHRRLVIGRNGEPFYAFKLRTMVQNAEQEEQVSKSEFLEKHKLKGDPRVTRVGTLLRKTSIDEIPQMINVLRGEMSVVGPRMISMPEREKFGMWDRKILSVKPGITGMWQVSGRSEISYEDRVRLNVYYVDHRSVLMDLSIMWKTIPTVFTGHGAY
jgi:lipopolysaccharide/colanic/teichoic acid biosynthesis glycosyltransferase